MALARQRLPTLAYDEQPLQRVLPLSFTELGGVAREWAKPSPDAVFCVRVPTELASLHASMYLSRLPLIIYSL
ncbi:hypothetical protein EDD17DRAFT_1606437, partial [Pisolithus thermaeus]